MPSNSFLCKMIAICQFTNYSDIRNASSKGNGCTKTKLACGALHTAKRTTSKESTNLEQNIKNELFLPAQFAYDYAHKTVDSNESSALGKP